MLYNSYITYNSYIVEWEITTNNYINVTLLGTKVQYMYTLISKNLPF